MYSYRSQMHRPLPLIVALVACIALAACGEKPIAVREGTDADYNQSALRQAVDKFVVAKRTPEAFAQFAKTVNELRSGMDHTVAKNAELRLIVLALVPMEAMKLRTMPEQTAALALTVWPTLLQPPIAADEVLIQRDPKATLLAPQADEDANAYLRRLCGGPLASECKQVVPEMQGSIVSALVIRKGMERVRNAVNECKYCNSEAGWHDAVRGWEELDRNAHGQLYELERKASPDNWPIAGSAAEDGSTLTDVTALWREAEINAIGEVVIGGQRYLGDARIAALRELRADSETITLHLRPEITLGQVKGLLADAKKSGASKVAVVARAPDYPWQRKIYWLSEAGATRVHLRMTDSLQLLLHTLDYVSRPGAVARVD